MSERPRPNLVLTGFMGTGKTTIGRLVAARLGYEFVDTDAVIEDRNGPIPTIFAEQGEPAFRAIERDVAAELAGRTGLVVSTGGAMLLDAGNAEILGRTGSVYCLVADADEIHRRVTDEATTVDRPLLRGPDPRARIEELLAERAEGYARFPQITTSGRTPEAVADELVAAMVAVQP